MFGLIQLRNWLGIDLKYCLISSNNSLCPIIDASQTKNEKSKKRLQKLKVRFFVFPIGNFWLNFATAVIICV